LPSVFAITLGKAGKSGVFMQFLPALPSAVGVALGKEVFAECDTRQSVYNCLFFSCFYIPTLPSHIQTENFTDIHHILQIHDIHHTSIPLSHIHHLHITNTI